MIYKTIVIKATTVEGVIEYLERITAPDPKELLDPLATGWGYILDLLKTPQ